VTEMPNLIGGVLCLDFVNTVDPRHEPGRREYLDDYAALVAWGVHAGAIETSQGERLREAAAGVPAEAEHVLSRAIRLREALYPLFSRAASGQPPGPDDLGVLQAELPRALPHLRVTWSPPGYAREWERGSPALDQVLDPRQVVDRRGFLRAALAVEVDDDVLRLSGGPVEPDSRRALADRPLGRRVAELVALPASAAGECCYERESQ